MKRTDASGSFHAGRDVANALDVIRRPFTILVRRANSPFLIPATVMFDRRGAIDHADHLRRDGYVQVVVMEGDHLARHSFHEAELHSVVWRLGVAAGRVRLAGEGR